MQSSQNRSQPREADDRRRGSSHFYADVYDQMEQPVVQRSPTRENASQIPQHQVSRSWKSIVRCSNLEAATYGPN